MHRQASQAARRAGHGMKGMATHREVDGLAACGRPRVSAHLGRALCRQHHETAIALCVRPSVVFNCERARIAGSGVDAVNE